MPLLPVEYELEEMGFVEVAKEFRADVPEHGISLHDNHHSQVYLLQIILKTSSKKKWQVLKSWIPNSMKKELWHI